ncbi:MAG: trypsin-like peptidase domain-containing protein [Pirellula sp.]|jgi:serine protease Do|nr:trypsin-like peptidase domain-containing protein [Pirellula sp.]
MIVLLSLISKIRNVAPTFTCFAFMCMACVHLPLVCRAEDQTEPSSSMDSLQDIEKKILQVLPKIKPCVVCVQTGGGSGSGVIVSTDGLVLTAAHVIDNAKELTIVYPDGRKFKGEALGTYGPADAGMARILEGAPHPFAEVHSGKGLSLHETVIALGHPSGFDLQRGPPLRIGHVTALDENYITTDTSLIGGDSGGPSFDLEGKVLGIHSHIAGEIQTNRDSHIAKFHENWEQMKTGVHHPQHYSKSIGSGKPQPGQDQESKTEPVPPRDPNEQSRLQDLAQKAKASGGKIKLSRDELRELRKNLALRTEALAPAGGTRLIDKWATKWITGFQSLLSNDKASSDRPSVVKVQVDGRNVALATCVHRDGWFVTKASEVKNRSVKLEISDQESLSAEVKSVDDALDLALLYVKTARSIPIRLLPNIGSSDTSKQPMGSLCFSVGTSDKPAGFGAISVAARPLNGKSGAFLGVGVKPEKESLRIESVAPNSPASKGGLKVGDSIVTIDGTAVRSEEELQKIVQSHLEGDQLKIDIERGDASLTVLARLEDATQLAPMPGAREQAMDSITASLSKRRWNFSNGIQHDCAISAKDVGGPLVGLDGRVMGINIARAGRIQSYAIPISDVCSFLISANMFTVEGVTK